MAKILVIRGGAIGDFILTLPAVGALRRTFPEAHLEILGYPHIIELAHGRGYAQAIRSLEAGPLARFFAPGTELDPEWSRYFASFQQIVSYLYDPDGIFSSNLSRAGVRHIISHSPKPPPSPIRPAAAHYLDALKPLAIYEDDYAATLHPSAEDHQKAAVLLPPDSRPAIMIHPGSGSDRKNWPVDRWAEIISPLSSSQRYRLVLIGGEADRETFARLTSLTNPSPITIIRDAPLPVLAAVLKSAHLFIGHDSGISHLAAAVGTSCLCLYGTTDPAIWAPQNKGVTILKRGNTMESITVPDVLEALEKILAH